MSISVMHLHFRGCWNAYGNTVEENSSVFSLIRMC